MANDDRLARRKRLWVTGGSLLALALGFLAGIWTYRTQDPALLGLIASLEPVGAAWVGALRMTVVPLVVAQLVSALIGAGGAGVVGRITSLSFVVFTLLLVLGAVVTVLTTPGILAAIHFSPEALAAFRAMSPAVPAADGAAAPGFGAWLAGLVPSNVARAAVQENLLGLMIFAVAFGLAVGRLVPERRALVAELSRAVADAMMIIVGWILWLMPLAVFVLAFSTAADAGLGAVDVVVTFVVLTCALLLAWTFGQYLIAAAAGGVSIGRFARAALPVQLLAVSTRSSLACLPALLHAGEQRLGLRPAVSSVVMPLAVSTFKVNRTITAPLQFLFLAYVYGVPLSTAQVFTFALAALLLSFSTLGIPSGGGMMRSMPLYIAAGIPIEGYLLVEAVESIPDVFKTLLNVTGNMTAASIVNRLAFRAAPAGEAAGVPAPAAAATPRVEGAAL